MIRLDTDPSASNPPVRKKWSGAGRAIVAVSVLAAIVGIGGSFGFLSGGSLEAQPSQIQGPVLSLADLSASDCYSFSLLSEGADLLAGKEIPATLGWTSSGVFFGDRLLLVDTTFDRLSKVAVGQYVKGGLVELPKAGTKVKLVDPFYAYPRPGGGYLLIDLLDDSASHLLFVDRYGEVEEEPMNTWGRVLHDKMTGRSARLQDVLKVVPMHNGVMAIAAFRDVEDANEVWDSFVYLERGDNNRYHPLEFEAGLLTEDLIELRKKFYSHDFNLMTVIDNVGYVLVMEKRPWIGKVEVGYPKVGSPKIERLAYLPSGYEVPGIGLPGRFRAQREAVEWLHSLYQAVENASMPAGLYAWKERLYVLLKTEANKDNGQTKWYLREVSQLDGSLADPIELPTRAQHLAFILGEDYMGFIEKGAIDILDASPLKALYRPARSARVMPVSWLSVPSQRKTACQHVAVGG